MIDQIAWLRAQMDEDERVAQAAAEAGECDCHPGMPADRWSYRDGAAEIEPDNDSGHIMLAGASYAGTWLRDEIGRHIALHDPARGLDEVAAKRRHIARYEEVDRLLGCDCPGWRHPQRTAVGAPRLPPGYR